MEWSGRGESNTRLRASKARRLAAGLRPVDWSRVRESNSPALSGLLGYGQLDTTIGSGPGIVLRVVLLVGLEPTPSLPPQGSAFTRFDHRSMGWIHSEGVGEGVATFVVGWI